jgi:predicted RNA-binding protein with RPS1 domain
MSILLIPGISSDNSKLIATYIKTYIKNILSNDNISLGINVVEQIINFISNNKLELKLKELLVSPISLIFEKDKSGVLLQSCQQKFMSIL